MKNDPDNPIAAVEQSAESNGAVPRSLEARFVQLAAQWKRESLVMSSPHQMERLLSYQQIIALGPAVVPWLLREMEHDPNFWFGALHVLTGANPVAPEHAGKIMLMAQDWVQWGREHGYRW